MKGPSGRGDAILPPMRKSPGVLSSTHNPLPLQNHDANSPGRLGEFARLNEVEAAA